LSAAVTVNDSNLLLGKVKRLRGTDTRFQLEGELQLDGKVISLSLSNDGKELITGTSSGKIYRV
jgi:hypothetical protein